MSGKINKKIWLPIVIALLCAAVIVAVVIVLTLPKKENGGHIVIEEPGLQEVRGELEISLVRERLETLTLDGNGVLTPAVDETVLDFSGRQDNIFGINGNILIGPRCYFSAHMAISNLKPYAFEYWLEIIPENGDGLLVDQLELTVTIDNATFIKRTLQSGLTTKVFPRTESGQTSKFTVSLEYLDTHNNDQTKNTTLAFDMIVHARLVQS